MKEHEEIEATNLSIARDQHKRKIEYAEINELDKSTIAESSDYISRFSDADKYAPKIQKYEQNEQRREEYEKELGNQFDYTAINLDIKWEPVDMIGNVLTERKEQSQVFHKLSIGSCPKYGDIGFPPNPGKAGVAELHTQHKNINTNPSSSRNAQKKAIYDNVFHNEPSQHVASVTIQVSSV